MYSSSSRAVSPQLCQIDLSKAARGRPEGPTEQSVFKFFFGMLANFRAKVSIGEGQQRQLSSDV